MSECCAVESSCVDACEKEVVSIKRKRDIFRFKANMDMAINLEHVYKMELKGKTITFYVIGMASNDPSADYVEFDEEAYAVSAFEQILKAWCSD